MRLSQSIATISILVVMSVSAYSAPNTAPPAATPSATGTAAPSPTSAPAIKGDFVIPVSLLSMITTLTPDQKVKIQAVEDKLKTDADAAELAGNRRAIRQLKDQAGSTIQGLLTSPQEAAVAGYRPLFFMLNKALRITPDELAGANLTSDQLSKLAQMSDDYNAQRKAIDDNRDQKLTALNADTSTKAKNILTPAQVASLAPPKRAVPTTNPVASK